MPGSFAELKDAIRPSYSPSENVVDGFYVPLLSRARAYDRVAGYFTSWGLAVAARGLADFVVGTGVMRLIVGAQLEADDLAALEDGAALAAVVARRLEAGNLWTELDEVRAYRLHLLAWLAHEGRLDVRVGIPRRPDGSLLAATETKNYFHDKFGVFTDDEGNKVAFSGSNNDSFQGWMGNSESFSVFPSWCGAWEWNGIDIVRRFERYWANEHASEWAIVPLSQAVRDRLLLVTEVSGPPLGPDPEQAHGTASGFGPPSPAHPEGLVDPGGLEELFDAPRRFPFTGVLSAGVLPLPHQMAVVDRAVRSFPRGYLFGDEVGLGKTIEIGLTIRELLLSGAIERSLLLVPAAVLGQWQEELGEKLALWVPRWTDGAWLWPDGTETAAKPGDPWASKEPITLVSSHLARRKDQRQRLLAAAPWDLVVVDEAHHARRSGGKANGTPNTLLGLLQDLHQQGGWRALYLASATPMQMYPHEAWDLIQLFDLCGWWAESAEKFEAYFRELGLEWERRQWHLLARMVHDNFADPEAKPNRPLDEEILATTGGPDRVLLVSRRAGREEVAIPRRLCTNTGANVRADMRWVQPLGTRPDLASLVTAWLYTNNPMRDRVFRNTRATLRAYRDSGIWPHQITIPDRLVNDAVVTMAPREAELYCEVQHYIRTKYDQAEQLASGQAKAALGFVLTIYRRRLTSSFQAIERSLRRRIAALEGELEPQRLLTEDDTILDDSIPGLTGEIGTWALGDEIHELHRLCEALHEIAVADETKMLRLHALVDDALAGGHQTVLVFTQYADTMDYIRDRLDAIYHGRVIGYSASGGTIHDAATGKWEHLTKRQTKELFAAGDRVKVLVGTDTLSEGLNLQTCGRLINYDLPWNFTRVEQRIGRVDRIGGHPRVEISNLLYDGTVETTVYRRLVETFGGFNAVVGLAQPVLGQVEKVIESASMVDDCDKEASPAATLFGEPTQSSGRLTLDSDVAKVIADANAADARSLARLDEHGSPVGGVNWPDARTLEHLRDELLSLPGIETYLRPGDEPGVWQLDLEGDLFAVTFDRSVLGRLAPDVSLLTWGSPLLGRLAEAAGRRASA